MSIGSISYYFTLFKKFQVLNHVPDQSVHGNPNAPTGGFQLNNPSSVFGGSNTFGNLLGGVGNTTPANSPLWQLLNAAALGQPTVSFQGYNGPSMPAGASASYPPTWPVFQLNAPLPIVTVFGNWISAGTVNDIPSGVVNPAGGAIYNVPATIAAPLATGVSLFVCSMANDNGVRPGPVPANYWDTSLISLVDPDTGLPATLANGTLNPGDEWFLVAVVGNRGTQQTGLFSYASNTTGVESAAVVMVWNTSFSPGVELPALSNLDVTDDTAIYQTYNMFSASYDVVGFRLNVQTVFNGIAAALTPVGSTPQTPQAALGNLSAVQWITDSSNGAHLCAKVVIRQQGGAFPNVGDTPITNPQIAQKNLAPFDINITDTDTNPNIIWKLFISGTPYLLIIKKGGTNRLTILAHLPENATRILFAIPIETYERYFRKGPGTVRGLREISIKTLNEKQLGARAKPFPDAVLFELISVENEITFPALEERIIAGFAIGIEYDVRKLRLGNVGEVQVVHRARLPESDTIVGGFTLQLRAVDSKRKK